MSKRRQLRVKPIKEDAKQFEIIPKTKKQDDLIRAIKTNPVVVTIGYAGTGKTYCSAGTIANLFLRGGYKKIVVSRPNIPTGKTLGSFPGNIKEKMAPWVAPILDVLRQALGDGRFDYMMSKDEIELQPIETIRGRSYGNCLILIDEAQNLSMEELKAVSTRIGEESKMIFMGDYTQSDVKNGTDLKVFCELLHKNGIQVPIIQFGVDDIVRSDIVAALIKMFVKEGI